MANKNETVDQVCAEMKEVAGIERFIDSHYCNHCGEPIDGEDSALNEYSDRVLAAHKREIADFQRRYDECVRKFNEADIERVRLRDEIAVKDAEIDRGEREYIRCREELRATRERRDDCEAKMHNAFERVTRAENALAAKDAEILSLKSKIDEYERQPELMADVATKALELLKRQDDEITPLRSLVKALADAIEKVLPENADCCHVESTLCKDGCMPNGKCNIDTIRALVANAREVCK